MKKRFLALAVIPALATCALFGACGSKKDGGYGSSGSNFIYPDSVASDESGGNAGGAGDSTATDPNYQYGSITETNFSQVSSNASSYFSLDRNTAGYSLMRSQIESKSKIYPDSVRIEELINYFDYNYEEPQEEAVALSTYLSPCPWNENNKLLTVGVKTQHIALEETAGNYVFLVDVSGSMSGDSRLGLAKKAFNILVDSLGGGDVVSVVKYASGTDVVLDGAECTESNKKNIKAAMNKLSAYGSTNGAGGLELAYQTAQKHFITGGNNRVIIISDGDFNVGISSGDELKEFIQSKAESGTYLSVVGVGMGNTRDDTLQTLATCGNGNYAYMDNVTEAQKIFLQDLNGTLKTVAKDAKAGVTFTENVEKYRLIGYDTKHISKEEYENEQTDAGELGSGLCSTAVYEITLKEGATGDLATAEVKYKDVRTGNQINTTVSKVITTEATYGDDVRFISCVAEFGLLLRNSAYKGSASYQNVIARLADLSYYTAADLLKQEFVTLVGKASETANK